MEMEEKLRRFVVDCRSTGGFSQLNSVVVVDCLITFWKSGNGDSNFSL